MKNTVLKILLIALLGWAAQYLSVWFAGPLTALLINLFWKGSSGQGFLSGFLGIGLLWLALALYTDQATDGLLTVKMAQIFPLNGSRVALISLTAFVGAFTAGMCGWTGALLRSVRD
ncbi:MAG: hypothetical protein MH137_12915 [Flavobacteriales bacterium]|nr:hypothetical protein [Flavobacteriales bacterium]